jgi:hypothetical protein
MKKYVSDLHQIYTSILAEADLISLIKCGAPNDEYSSEARMCMELGRSITTEHIKQIFIDQFDPFDVSHISESQLNTVRNKMLEVLNENA